VRREKINDRRERIEVRRGVFRRGSYRVGNTAAELAANTQQLTACRKVGIHMIKLAKPYMDGSYLPGATIGMRVDRTGSRPLSEAVRDADRARVSSRMKSWL